MHIVLLNPRAQKSHRRLPLSLLFLARGIPDSVTWEIRDGNVEPDALARAEAAVARDPSGTVVFVTVMPGPQLRVAVPWCRTLKSRFPETTVVWGGYFPTVYPEACARDPAVDIVVIGQGEETVAELVDALETGHDPVAVAGCAVWRDGALQKGPDRRFRASARFGPAAYDRLDMERYAAPTFLGRRTFNHHASVGCPYVCNFCAVTTMLVGAGLRTPPRTSFEPCATWRPATMRTRSSSTTTTSSQQKNACGPCRMGLPTSTPVVGRRPDRHHARMVGCHLDCDAAWPCDGVLRCREWRSGRAGRHGQGLEVEQIRALNRGPDGRNRPEFAFVLGNPADPEGDIERRSR